LAPHAVRNWRTVGGLPAVRTIRGALSGRPLQPSDCATVWDAGALSPGRVSDQTRPPAGQGAANASAERALRAALGGGHVGVTPGDYLPGWAVATAASGVPTIGGML